MVVLPDSQSKAEKNIELISLHEQQTPDPKETRIEKT